MPMLPLTSRVLAQTCGRCRNGVIAQQSLPELNPRADLNRDYNYDYQWQQGRSTNYGAPRSSMVSVVHSRRMCLVPA